MSNQPNDRIAADPVVGRPKPGSFNYLWLLPLLLIPLLFFMCNRRTDEPSAARSAQVGNTAAANPFTADSSGKVVLNFEANATTPNAPTAGLFPAIAAYLKANPSARVALKGYTDNTGSAEVNQRLTQQRIEAVRGALTAAGVDVSRIASANYGETYPVTDNSTPQARELNRRVEIELAK